jgi:hypothetical protein
MAVKTFVEDIEDVAEPLREHYKETTDAVTKKTIYVLDTEGKIDLLPAVKQYKTELGAKRQELKVANEKLQAFKVFEGLDAEEVIKYPELEAAAAGKLDDEKINGIVEQRVKAKLTPLERETQRLKTELADKDTKLQTFEQKEKSRTILDAVARAGKDVKLLDTALEDAVMLGERHLTIDDEGNVTSKDGLSVKDWLTDMQSKRPHWWGPTTGGNAKGGRGGGNLGAANPWTAANWNMTEQTKIFNVDPKRAEQLAAAAGTKLGGRKPADKAA